MANAVCDNCKGKLSWHAGRGARLADLRCPLCGGPLRAARHGTSGPEIDERGFRVHHPHPDEDLNWDLRKRAFEKAVAGERDTRPGVPQAP